MDEKNKQIIIDVTFKWLNNKWYPVPLSFYEINTKLSYRTWSFLKKSGREPEYKMFCNYFREENKNEVLMILKESGLFYFAKSKKNVLFVGLKKWLEIDSMKESSDDLKNIRIHF